MAAEKLQPSGYRALAEVLKKFETEILTQWVSEQLAAITMRRDLRKESQSREQSRRFLSVLQPAVQIGGTDIRAP
jgi:hypothetical protein